MFKHIIAILSTVALFSIASSQTSPDSAQSDRLGQALQSVGFSRADLGFQPKGYWNRFPNPKEIPYIMPFFEDLFTEPLKTFDYSKTMGNAIARYLDPSYFDTSNSCLYNIVYSLGVDRKLTGFRNYGVNLDPRFDSANPMLDAFAKIELGETRQVGYGTFNNNGDWPYDKKALETKLKAIPIQFQRIMAALILNVYDAYKWRQLAVRNLNPDDMEAIFRIDNLSGTLGDGQVYYPEIDDIAKNLDEQSLNYSSLKAVQAAESAYKELKKYNSRATTDYSNINFEYFCPIGRIVIRGVKDDITDYSDAAILIDLGGNDTYHGAIAATATTQLPISIAIDMSGNDIYENANDHLPTQGTGILGAGILIDGSGKDIYKSVTMSQGCGFFGTGVLLDIDGDDDYKLQTSGQGCGYFGLGFALDIKGSDTRYLYGDGQGYGGVAGVGVIADYLGDDKYSAEPLASVADRGDYHSQGKINANGAQGAGMGRRGDGSDGHSWAGGLGALIDIKGNDQYYSGNWTLGCGYWFGTGIVYEGEGNDLYKSVYFTQASGAHYCIGVILDEGGDDKHELWETAGAGIAFGWDYAIAMLYDKGGNDQYIAKIISLGCAQIRSDALLIDIGGDDYYQLAAGQEGFGAATYRDSYDHPSLVSPFDTYAKSFGLLLDIGGKDTYVESDTTKAKPIPSAKCADNSNWFSPAKGSEHYGANNYGVGMDIEQGRVPDFELWGK
jgi:hypothetical protein